MNKFLAIAAVMGLMACGGGNEQQAANTDTASVNASNAATVAPATGTVAAMPITGTTHEVKMVGDDKGYRFDPADITVKAGDGIKFTVVSMGPHNVAFDPAAVPADAKAQLAANMSNTTSELTGPMLMNANDSYTISFAGVKPGTYEFHCTPHLAMNMKGKVTVE